eukprot:TRINITY_DN5951_c0_g5_i1.p1 TRINITY_DN5951_c0_g5~~TRINITY_DN5951_c0_g5_i1.p1  ORF type:complete len:1080 (+),score=211.44 TRINITY_DN5951_c0_g5_i1:64-3303(+)
MAAREHGGPGHGPSTAGTLSGYLTQKASATGHATSKFVRVVGDRIDFSTPEALPFCGTHRLAAIQPIKRVDRHQHRYFTVTVRDGAQRLTEEIFGVPPRDYDRWFDTIYSICYKEQNEDKLRVLARQCYTFSGHMIARDSSEKGAKTISFSPGMLQAFKEWFPGEDQVKACAEAPQRSLFARGPQTEEQRIKPLCQTMQKTRRMEVYSAKPDSRVAEQLPELPLRYFPVIEDVRVKQCEVGTVTPAGLGLARLELQHALVPLDKFKVVQTLVIQGTPDWPFRGRRAAVQGDDGPRFDYSAVRHVAKQLQILCIRHSLCNEDLADMLPPASRIAIPPFPNLVSLEISGSPGFDSIPSEMRYLRKLVNLTLNDNALTKVENLPMDLTNLFARNNRISDVTELAHCDSLRSVDLSNNLITDVLPFCGLSNLLALLLGGNPIATWDSIKRLHERCFALRKLSLEGSHLTPGSGADYRHLVGEFFEGHPEKLELDGQNVSTPGQKTLARLRRQYPEAFAKARHEIQSELIRTMPVIRELRVATQPAELLSTPELAPAAEGPELPSMHRPDAPKSDRQPSGHPSLPSHPSQTQDTPPSRPAVPMLRLSKDPSFSGRHRSGSRASARMSYHQSTRTSMPCSARAGRVCFRKTRNTDFGAVWGMGKGGVVLESVRKGSLAESKLSRFIGRRVVSTSNGELPVTEIDHLDYLTSMDEVNIQFAEFGEDDIDSPASADTGGQDEPLLHSPEDTDVHTGPVDTVLHAIEQHLWPSAEPSCDVFRWYRDRWRTVLERGHTYGYLQVVLLVLVHLHIATIAPFVFLFVTLNCSECDSDHASTKYRTFLVALALLATVFQTYFGMFAVFMENQVMLVIFNILTLVLAGRYVFSMAEYMDGDYGKVSLFVPAVMELAFACLYMGLSAVICSQFALPVLYRVGALSSMQTAYRWAQIYSALNRVDFLFVCLCMIVISFWYAEQLYQYLVPGAATFLSFFLYPKAVWWNVREQRKPVLCFAVFTGLMFIGQAYLTAWVFVKRNDLDYSFYVAAMVSATSVVSRVLMLGSLWVCVNNFYGKGLDEALREAEAEGWMP